MVKDYTEELTRAFLGYDTRQAQLSIDNSEYDYKKGIKAAIKIIKKLNTVKRKL